MNLLILSCHTGQGHDSSSEAVREVWEARGHRCETVDALGLVSERLSRGVCRFHSWMYRHAPGFFDWGYGFVDKRPSLFREKGLVRRVLSRGCRKLWEILEKGGYDAVLCTHVFSGILLGETLRDHPFSGTTAFLATDYTCSPGVGALKMDYCFIPDASLAEEFCAKGVPAGLVMAVGGIPVRESFRRRVDREKAAVLEGLPAGCRHVLMMCGSMGCGPMEELACRLAEELPEDTCVTVVCGTNRKLYDRLTKKLGDRKNIRLLGFVKDISLLMDSADVYLTKPGGISTTEAAAKGLPMVLVDAVAGCEENNLRYFTQCGGAVTADTPAELVDLCREVLTNDTLRENMSLALRSRELSSGAQNIAECFLERRAVRECG